MEPSNRSDPFDLARFTQAQDGVWTAVREELQAGRKQTHWMWFVFPQLADLGRSAAAKHYGLSGLEEARAYLAHPVLGARLRETCQLLLALQGRSATEIFGAVDAMKLRSSLTLFAAVAPQDEVFAACLQRYFDGEPDPLTLEQLR
jgi:uncharacterized protein (DUF1810 family)